MMGGIGAHEYMAPCPAGENEVALAPGYAANIEVATRRRRSRSSCRRALDSPREAPTPGLTTVDEVAAALGVPAGRADQGDARSSPTSAASCWSLVRGDHRLNEIKLANHLGAAVPARRAPRRSPRRSARPASSARSAPRCRSSRTRRSPGAGLVAGANTPDAHLIGVEPGPRLRLRGGSTCARSRPATRRPAATRSRSSRRSRSATSSSSAPATRSRSGRRYLDDDGKEQPIVMGSYGIGPARIVAAAIEQRADEKGIVWPRGARAVAGPPGRARQARATRSSPPRSGSTTSSPTPGIETVFDDRATPAPARSSPTPSCSAVRCGSSVGKRGLADGSAEAQVRATGARRTSARPTPSPRVEALLAELG